MPIAAKIMADCFAPLRPITSLNRPYRGVNVQVAKRYLSNIHNEYDIRGKRGVFVMTYAVPTQLASLDLLKSEDIEGSTKTLFRLEYKNFVGNRPTGRD